MFSSRLVKTASNKLLFVRYYSSNGAGAVSGATATASIRFTPSSDTIPNRLEKVSAKYPFNDALLFPREIQALKFNFKQLWENVSGLASGLVETNIKNNETLLTNAPQNAEHLITQMATSSAGIKFVPVAPESTLPEIGSVLKTAEPKVLIVAELKNREMIEETIAYFPTLESMEFDEYFKDTRFPNLKHIITTGDGQEPGIDLYKEFVLQNNLLKNRKPTKDQISTLIPSENGTLIGYTQSNLINTGDALTELLGIKLSGRVSFNVPFHTGTSYAFYLGCLSRGAVVIVPHETFTVESTLSSISKDKSSVLFVNSEQLSEIVSNKSALDKHDLSSLTTVVIVGDQGSNDDLVAKLQAKAQRIRHAFTLDTVKQYPGQLSGYVFNNITKTGYLLPGIESKVQDKKLMTKGYHLNSNVKDWLDTTLNVKINPDQTVTKL